jgi:hypothetical protein
MKHRVDKLLQLHLFVQCLKNQTRKFTSRVKILAWVGLLKKRLDSGWALIGKTRNG